MSSRLDRRSLALPPTARHACLVTLATVAMAQPVRAADLVYHWFDGGISGLWSDTAKWTDISVPVDGTGDPADDVNLSDGTVTVARFQHTNAGRTVTLDSSRTIGKLYYNWNGTATVATGARTLTIAPANGSVLTLAADAPVAPQICVGRFRQDSSGSYTDSLVISAPLAGTQGFSVTQSASYIQDGIILAAANTISGPVNNYTLLTLKHAQALEYATLYLRSTLRLRSDVDGTTFLVGNLTQLAQGTINVDQATTGGGTGKTLRLLGPFATTSNGTIWNLSGGNGFKFEFAGSFSNKHATAQARFNANTANATFSGSPFHVGTGLQLGGTAASGVNNVSSSIGGGSVTKLADASTWALTGVNSYTGPTAVNGGTLLVDGGSIGTTAATGDGVTVAAGATLGGTGTIYADVTLATNAIVSAGSVDAAGSLIGTLTIGDAAQAAGIAFGDDAVLAVDVASATGDLLVVKGAATLGAVAGDEVTVAVRELDVPTGGQGVKVLQADGGITIAGSVRVTGSDTLTRYALRSAGAELWILPTPPAGTTILLR